MERFLYPVGQGAFYAEVLFNSKTFIYDCGSSSEIKYLDESIKVFCEMHLVNDVDGLFISHFHKDHINGIAALIQALKQNGKKIKRIFLPKLTSNQNIFNLLTFASFQNSFKDNQDLIKLISDPVNYFYRVCDGVRICQIQNEQMANESERTKEIIELNDEALTDGDYTVNYSSQTRFQIKAQANLDCSPSWEYVPFNFTSFKENDINIILENNNLSSTDFIDIDTNKWARIQSLALKIQLNKNESSMVLFSSASKEYSCCRTRRYSALYMGDYPTRYDEYLKRLCAFIKDNEIIKRCCFVQIAHHGSAVDFTKDAWWKFYSKFNKFFVSYGTNNSYGHPCNSIRLPLPSLPYVVKITEHSKVKHFYGKCCLISYLYW